MNLTELIAEAELLNLISDKGPWLVDPNAWPGEISVCDRECIVVATVTNENSSDPEDQKRSQAANTKFIARSRTLLPLLVKVIKNQQRQIEVALLALENLEDPILSDTVSTTAEDALTELIAINSELEDIK